jgi:hypothetical protein
MALGARSREPTLIESLILGGSRVGSFTRCLQRALFTRAAFEVDTLERRNGCIRGRACGAYRIRS